jgi:hypothetical protein
VGQGGGCVVQSARSGRTLQKLSLDNYTTVICSLEEFGILVCKEYYTAVVNLDVHLRDQHAIPAAVRKQIIQQLSHFPTTVPGTVELPEQPAWPIEELGTQRDGLMCKTCEFITVSTDAIRKHCKKKTLACVDVWEKRAVSLCQSPDVLQ